MTAPSESALGISLPRSAREYMDTYGYRLCAQLVPWRDGLHPVACVSQGIPG